MSDLDPETPSLTDLMRDAMNAALTQVFTALPGVVTEYDASTQLATVQPAIKRTTFDADGNSVSEGLPAKPNTPVLFASAGGFALSFPVQRGDTVLLVFSKWSIDRWLQGDGAATDPAFLHSFDLSDAIAIPGLRVASQKLTSASESKLVIGKDDTPSMQITIDGTTIKLSDNATNFVALANLVQTALDAIKATLLGGIAVSGATGTFNVTLSPTLNTNVAATKVKAE